MKVLINHNTRLNGEHLEANKVHDIEEKHAKFLIKLGRATKHIDSKTDSEIFTEISEVSVPKEEDLNKEEVLKDILKTKDIEDIENREEELKTKTVKRNRKK